MKRAGTVAAEIRSGRTESAGGRVRFSPQARMAAVAHVRQRQAEGAALAVAAREIGVEYRTLRDWLRLERPPMRPVSIAAEPPRVRELVLVLPGGVRVEGLDLHDVLELARELR